MGAHAGPVLDASVYNLWDKIIYHYDLSLDVCTNDMYKMNTIDNTSGYDSFTRVFDLSGKGRHLIQATKSSQPVVDSNRYTKFSGRTLSRSISYQSYVVDGETSQRLMSSAASTDPDLEFGSWTCYCVNQFDGHFRHDASANTRWAIFQPLGDIDNNAEWDRVVGSGVIYVWQNSNNPPGGTTLNFRGYGYGNHYLLPEDTGVGFDISDVYTVSYDGSTYGVPTPDYYGGVDTSRELKILTVSVEKGVAARQWCNHNATGTGTDSTIEDVSTMTFSRAPSVLKGGRIGEVLMFSEYHDEDQRLKIHQFLSRKWAIKLNQLTN